MCGVNAAILTSGLGRLMAGNDHATATGDMLAEADLACDLLANGLAGWSSGS
jgi:hypothetical protein